MVKNLSRIWKNCYYQNYKLKNPLHKNVWIIFDVKIFLFNKNIKNQQKLIDYI